MTLTDTAHRHPAPDLEAARLRLPLTDPDRHALDTDADDRFAALAAHWGEAA